MEGHRLTATIISNLLADKPVSPAQFLPLPIVDGSVKPGLSAEALDELKALRDRMAAQNVKKLAEQAAS